MKQALQTRMLGYATDETRHPMAPQEIVYEVEAPVPRHRKHIPLGAKLVGIYIILGALYILVQGGFSTFS